MKWISLVICLFAIPTLHAQSVHFRELKFPPNPHFYNTTDSSIIFPIVVAGDPAIGRLINKKIEATVLDFGPDVHGKSIREKLRKMIEDGLTDMSYEATYNEKGILSMRIDLGLTGAYPSTAKIYLNFDFKTGRPLELKDLIIDSVLLRKFTAKVFADKVDSLKKYKDVDLKTGFENKDIDSSTYEWAIDEIDDNCIKSVDISNFSLSKSGITIQDRCEFPHAIRGMSPTYELNYSYQFMHPFLKPKFQGRLPNR